MRSLAAGAIALALVSLPHVAAAQPITIHGRTYASWAEYYTSPQFLAAPARCGTPSPVRLESSTGGSGFETDAGSPNDCSLTRTRPGDEYEPQAVLEITVVVHRFESLTGMGVYPDSMVQSQIDILNEDFLALAGTPGAPGKNTRLIFKLATQDPEGNPHPGWTKTTNEFWFNDAPDPLLGYYYEALAWDPNRYLNIYTLSPVAPGGVVLGYVPFLPQDDGAGTNEDGVRVLWNAFGRNSANAPYDQGRTATHEVGHWLGLYHTFDGGCGEGGEPQCFTTGDLVCDTEPDETSHGGCPTDANTCDDPDPIRNYMEYTDDACMNNFTPQQARRMRCSIEHYRPQLTRTVVAVEPRERAGAALAMRIEPNPAPSRTRISFTLDRAAPVTLAIADVTGRTVRTLAREPFAAGLHHVAWDGADDRGAPVRPGAYFARIVTEDGVATRRLVLLR
jgi:hypothetical protein